eukprot:39469-Lingulodinium_polyedra.AAC.1
MQTVPPRGTLPPPPAARWTAALDSTKQRPATQPSGRPQASGHSTHCNPRLPAALDSTKQRPATQFSGDRRWPPPPPQGA